MRTNVTPTVAVKQGDRVVIAVRNPKDCLSSRVGVWTSVGGAEFSPHVQEEAYMSVGDPVPVKPLYTQLFGAGRKHSFVFIADEDMSVKLVQDRTVADDKEPLVKARIKSYGQTSQKIRQYLRNRKWPFRRQNGKNVRLRA